MNSLSNRRHFCRSATYGSVALAAAVASGCTPSEILDALVPHSGYRLAANLPYRNGPRGKLDLYTPENATPPFPLVVFIYGGNWRTGDKGTYRFVGQALASRGFAVAIPDYRLYPEVRFPEFLEDNVAAVAWTRAHGDDLQLEAAWLYLMGHSAGAYSAAMLALDPRWLAAVGLDPSRDLGGFVGLAGPYDFLPLDDNTEPVFGSAPDERLTQPVSFASGNAPPVFLAAGLADTTVDPRNTFSLAAAVRRRGGRAEVKTYPGVGHIRLIADIAEPLQTPRVPLLGDIVGFLSSTA